MQVLSQSKSTVVFEAGGQVSFKGIVSRCLVGSTNCIRHVEAAGYKLSLLNFNIGFSGKPAGGRLSQQLKNIRTCSKVASLSLLASINVCLLHEDTVIISQ